MLKKMGYLIRLKNKKKFSKTHCKNMFFFFCFKHTEVNYPSNSHFASKANKKSK